MKLHIIDAGIFLCDGGGIFGSVPKTLWERHIKADKRNLIKLSMRCLLVEHENRKILIETGCGDKLSQKFILNNGIENPHLLIESLSKKGFKPEDITDVVHTHLHWDHCGGGTKFNEKNEPVITFSNATYHCSSIQWENALNPNPREDDAFFTDDLIPVMKSGRLNLIKKECELFPGFNLKIFNGHTPGMIVPVIFDGKNTIAYISDLAPLAANIPIKWVCSYDLYPVTSMEEKLSFFREAYEKKYLLLFEHDTKFECATLKWDNKKGPMVNSKGDFSFFLLNETS